MEDLCCNGGNIDSNEGGDKKLKFKEYFEGTNAGESSYYNPFSNLQRKSSKSTREVREELGRIAVGEQGEDIGKLGGQAKSGFRGGDCSKNEETGSFNLRNIKGLMHQTVRHM
jgi:hypothetical protein